MGRTPARHRVASSPAFSPSPCRRPAPSPRRHLIRTPARESLRQAVARGWPGGEPDPDSVTRAALRAWALVHGLGQLLLDGQLDWLEEDPLGLAEAVLADTV